MTTLIRPAQLSDCEAIQALVQELADYEKAPEQVITTVADLEKQGFSNSPLFTAFVAEVNGEVVGFALTFWKYSTWKGRILYLEDFYVKADFRKYGLGAKLFTEVVKLAHENNCERLDWAVLNWNEIGMNFYRKIGATLDNEWSLGMLFKKDITRLVDEGI